MSKTLEALSDAAIVEMEYATVLSASLRATADRINQLRAIAADIAVESVTEQAKRQLLLTWATGASHLVAAADMAAYGPKTEEHR